MWTSFLVAVLLPFYTEDLCAKHSLMFLCLAYRGRSGVEIATRSIRKPSASTNPLQFVKTKESSLHKKAREQIKIYEKVKKEKQKIRNDEEEWQSVSGVTWEKVN